MKRALRKPAFWVALIAGTLGVHVLIVVGILHHRLLLPHRGDPEQGPFSTNNALRLLRPPPPTESEDQLWQRLLEEDTLWDCPSHSKNNATSPIVSEDAGSLIPSGFREHVRRFRRGIPGSAKVQKLCYLPPSKTACDRTQYSVVVTSRATDLRRLLLNLMSLQSYPSVADVTVVLPSTEEWHQLQANHLYGGRLLDWHHRGNLHFVLGEKGLLDSLGVVQPQQEAVLFLDGDVHKDWNGTQLLTNFWIWRQHSSSLIQSVATTSEPCPSKLHGTFLHRNLLCFLGHPVIAPLRKHLYQRRDPWTAAPQVLALLWNRLGDGHLQVSSTRRSTRLEVSFTENTVQDYLGCSCALKSISPLAIHSTCSSEDLAKPA